MAIDATEVQSILPHRYPFLFIDRVVEVVPDESVVAEHLVSMSSGILQGHFPGHPVLPGVVQVEAMAQAAVILAHQSGRFDAEKHHCYFMGIKDAKFRGVVAPGDVLSIRVKAERLGRVGKFSGECYVGEELKSSATVTAVIEPKAKPEAKADDAG
jgi:3-hydroxyacyl-[acyl-carrier-protein] dehydratase